MTFKILYNEDFPMITIVTPPVEFNVRDGLLLFSPYNEKTEEQPGCMTDKRSKS